MTDTADRADHRGDEQERTTQLRILIVDDDRTLREGCANVLQLDGHHVVTFARGEDAIEAAQRQHFDIALVDLYMTPVSGMDVLRAIGAADRRTLVVVMTGNPTVASSLEALRAGAWDYLPKPFSASHLQVLVGRAAHAARAASAGTPDVRDTRVLQAATGISAPAAIVERVPEEESALIGDAPAFRQAIAMAKRVAGTDASVMIFGESGTGKELIAQFIHRHSRRGQRKLVPVNCAAIPGALLESEMFGHKKGAFTGADRDKAGLLEVANGGTFFLDELGEMPMPLQAKLLRVLQDGVVRRVGSEKQDAVVDVRFVSATNRDPREAVQNGLLREDLFYRLCVVPIRLPALRQRPEDIPLLARHFLQRFWGRHRKAGVPLPLLTEEAIRFLQTRAWKGNVRELQNVMEHVTVVAEPGKPITPDDIPIYEEVSAEPGNAGGLPAAIFNESFHTAKEQLVAHFEREYLTRLTARAAGNMSKAARLASIDRTTLYRLLEKHNIRRDDAAAALATFGD
ncbi:sigma-54 dependent transcriptional regulator [Roseisolibacter sp. H3M3-2]|uniref:sigma-54-dependent transcriptional regulator n=1 Tax=Roseisolibacter sp. H3M3-2 TaxID=3031323 RepID=UPI0023DC7CAB|nr:sigma-54 dependent transcriptional regulator [Roseisolibacter sp. H3M3-2]MDF1502858.1 sigma-54 dependent transcriptional regulator [Roseisolibacter sp. H3M3-2]